MLLTVDPIPGEYYNIGGTYSCTVGQMLDYLISISNYEGWIAVETESLEASPSRRRSSGA